MTTKTKNILKTVGILLIGILIGSFIFGSDDASKSEQSNDNEQAQKTIWTCSMHPQIRMDKPGKCPICGMDLIPLEFNESAVNPNAIQMTEDAMKLANIQTMKVGSGSSDKALRLNGKVQIDERKLYTQSTHIPGRIENLTVNFTGERVSRGQTLATVYSPELVTAQEELLQAYVMKASQPELFTAAKQKLSNWKIGEKTINSIISNGKPIQKFPITADVSGIITAKKVDLGDYVNRGTPIYEIADLSSLWVLFDVYESDMPWIKVGDKISYTVPSIPGKTFEGKISFIDPLINPQTRVASARVEVKNSDGMLKPEMFVSGVLMNKLNTQGSKDIVIPKSAVMWTGERSIVYIKNNTGNKVSFILRNVTLGASLGDSYVVDEGLNVGDEIVVNGTFTVDAASQLAGKPSMMDPDAGTVMAMETTDNAPKKEINFNVSGDETNKKAIAPLISAYLEMKDAMVADDFNKAKSYGTKLLTLTNKVDMGLFKGKSHEAWMTFYNDINSELQHMAHFNKLDEIRKTFVNVSNTMISMANTFKTNENLFVLHCPMANDNKGADWLSNSKDIKNPYYGKAMLTCGEVKDSIKN